MMSRRWMRVLALCGLFVFLFTGMALADECISFELQAGNSSGRAFSSELRLIRDESGLYLEIDSSGIRNPVGTPPQAGSPICLRLSDSSRAASLADTVQEFEKLFASGRLWTEVRQLIDSREVPAVTGYFAGDAFDEATVMREYCFGPGDVYWALDAMQSSGLLPFVFSDLAADVSRLMEGQLKAGIADLHLRVYDDWKCFSLEIREKSLVLSTLSVSLEDGLLMVIGHRAEGKTVYTRVRMSGQADNARRLSSALWIDSRDAGYRALKGTMPLLSSEWQLQAEEGHPEKLSGTVRFGGASAPLSVEGVISRPPEAFLTLTSVEGTNPFFSAAGRAQSVDFVPDNGRIPDLRDLSPEQIRQLRNSLQSAVEEIVLILLENTMPFSD